MTQYSQWFQKIFKTCLTPGQGSPAAAAAATFPCSTWADEEAPHFFHPEDAGSERILQTVPSAHLVNYVFAVSTGVIFSAGGFVWRSPVCLRKEEYKVMRSISLFSQTCLVTDCWKLSLKWVFKCITLNILSVNDNIGLNLFRKRIVFWKSNRQRFKDKDVYRWSSANGFAAKDFTLFTVYLQFIQNCDLINTRSHACFWVRVLSFSNGALSYQSKRAPF